jgi:uncharacterized protein YecE (DUF72 family)
MLYIGTSGWHYADWINVFYPRQLPKSAWLSYYAQHFNVVEINATYYRKFSIKSYQNWYEQVPSDFKFIVKAPRVVTHIKNTPDLEIVIQQFCETVTTLREKLGLVLLQFPASLPLEDLARVEHMIACFKSHVPIAVEFRHTRWQTAAVQQMLKQHQCITCNADSPSTISLNWVTSNIAYLRLHGRTQWFDYSYTENELQEVYQAIKAFKQQDAKEIYILFNNTMKAGAIANIAQLKELV